MREHTKQNDAHSILLLPDKTFSNARECMNGSTPSTGLVTVQLALRVCKAPVHLYGFYPHCCYDEGWARPWWQGLNYKYFHTNSSQWVCWRRAARRAGRTWRTSCSTWAGGPALPQSLILPQTGYVGDVVNSLNSSRTPRALPSRPRGRVP